MIMKYVKLCFNFDDYGLQFLKPKMNSIRPNSKHLQSFLDIWHKFSMNETM